MSRDMSCRAHDNESADGANAPMPAARRRLIRAARSLLWARLRPRVREQPLARSRVRRRLANFLARCASSRLVAILRSAALAGAVASSILAPHALGGQELPTIDLADIARGEGGFAVRGEGQPGARGGGVLVGAGDVNGDGIPDFLAPGSILYMGIGTSAPVYVVFGTRSGRAIELADVEEGKGGFTIQGTAPDDLVGPRLAGPGDVNGDGLDDVLIGAPGAGEVYVVFGKADSAPLQLSEVQEGRGGFAIRGSALNELLKVAAAGDVNGDGLGDIVIGSWQGSPAGKERAGEAFVVFGKPAGAAVDLADIEAGRGGFAVHGGAEGDGLGWSVASAGDVNGDGRADVIVGAPRASPAGRQGAGEAIVVFGKSEGAAVEAAEVEAGEGGFAIRGTTGGLVGLSVSGAGDVNGDGLDDVVLGDPGSTPGGGYVVFGTPGGDGIDLGDVRTGNGGFAILGVQGSYGVGVILAGAGDVNGDGLDDILMGDGLFKSFVILGKSGGAAVDISQVLAGAGGFELRRRQDEFNGASLGGAGDVNGDGLADILIDSSPSHNEDSRLPGDGHVVFGKAEGAPVELADVAAGQGGFAVRGIQERDLSSLKVAGAGDVNGDGRADILITGLIRHRRRGSVLWGEARVIFGSAGGAGVDLVKAPSEGGGFVIRAMEGRDLTGGLAGAGDVNGDGFDDVILGAPDAAPGGTGMTGESYVVFGGPGAERVELFDVMAGRGGFAIRGAGGYNFSGWRVAGAGDVNGDGLADVVISAPRASPGGRGLAGECYVVFGKTDGTLVELSNVRAAQGGFVMRGAAEGDSAGLSVTGAGDVNGDGLGDVVVGAPGAQPGGRRYAGESYVVFGKPERTAIELADVQKGMGGFAIQGVTAGRATGASVAGAGDVNGDGFADVLIGEAFKEGGGPGAVHVVFGKASGTPVTLSAIQAGAGGFAIRGASNHNFVGLSLSTAGDFNGDGLDDILLDGTRSESSGPFAGDSYVVFGKESGALVELGNLPQSQDGFVIHGATAQIALRNERSFATVTWAGDVDGDGLADDIVIASGLPGVRYPGVSGAAYVVFGPRDGGASVRFRRGAVRGEEGIVITDAIVLLEHLFLGAAAPPCLDAADTDDSGVLDLADAIGLLGHLFQGAAAPPAPGPASCGRDPTEDELRCASSTQGCGP